MKKELDLALVQEEAMTVFDDLLSEEEYSEEVDAMYFRKLCDVVQLNRIIPAYLEDFIFVVGPADHKSATIKIMFNKGDDEYEARDKPLDISIHDVAIGACTFFSGKIQWSNQGESTLDDTLVLLHDADNDYFGEYCEENEVDFVRFEVHGKPRIVSENEESATIHIDFEISNFEVED